MQVITKLALALLASSAACASDPPGEGKTYVLVHGAWMGAAGWDPVAARLRAEGATVRTFDLPAHGGDLTPPGEATLEGYVERVSSELDAAGTPVILVGHSLGGMVISAVAERRPADLDRLVYLGAYVPADGQSLGALAMLDAGSQIGPALRFHDDGTVDVDAAAFPALFCADCDAAAGAALVAGYRAEPAAPIGTQVTLTAAFAGVAKTYLHTTQDRVISPAFQHQMTEVTAFDRASDLAASHAALLSAPDEVAAALLAE